MRCSVRRFRPLVFALVAVAAVLGAACTEDEPEATPAPTASASATATAAPTESATPEPTAAATETAAATPTGVVAGDGCANLAPEGEEASFVFAVSPQPGTVLASGDTVIGCSRTFESHVPWLLLDREGNELIADFTMGGGVDGHAPFEFTVTYTVSEPQFGTLVIKADDPSGGEGFPPSEHRIPVVLLP